jgi:uncharacterized membrane protein YfcA
MILGLSAGVVALLALALLVGATVQGTVGLGLGLVGAPIAALVAPETMPDLLLWLALLMPVVTLVKEHYEIDWGGLAWSLPLRVPGTLVGVLLVTWFSTQQLGVAIAVMVLTVVALTARAVVIPVRRWTLMTAGLVSGVTGTATSIGGPPMALLYQHRSGRQVRSTLGIYFVVGAAMSLVGLGVAGELSWRDLQLAALLVPVLVLGFAVSGPIRRHVDAGHTRVAVLCVCAASALVLLVRSLL